MYIIYIHVYKYTYTYPALYIESTENEASPLMHNEGNNQQNKTQPT